jgi:hypothetical protein
MCFRCDDFDYDPCPENFEGCEGSCYGFDCMDCRANTLHLDEFYMVHDEIWESAIPKKKRTRMICIGCLEKRLGRLLTPQDFTDAPVNKSWIFVSQSERLLNRLGKTIKA